MEIVLASGVNVTETYIAAQAIVDLLRLPGHELRETVAKRTTRGSEVKNATSLHSARTSARKDGTNMLEDVLNSNLKIFP